MVESSNNFRIESVNWIGKLRRTGNQDPRTKSQEPNKFQVTNPSALYCQRGFNFAFLILIYLELGYWLVELLLIKLGINRKVDHDFIFTTELLQRFLPYFFVVVVKNQFAGCLYGEP